MAKKGRFRSDSSSKDEMPKAKITGKALKRSSRLFGYMGKHRWKFYFGLVFLGLTAATALIFPGLLGKLMGIIGGDTGSTLDAAKKLDNTFLTSDLKAKLLTAANTVGIQLIILFAFQAVFSFFRVYLFSQATENMLASLRQATFSRLMRMAMGFYSKNQAAELNSRISSDITQIGDTLTTGVAEFLRQLIIVVGGMIIIFTISWEMALKMLAIIPPIAVITVLFGRRIRKHSRNVQDKIADSNIIVGESLQGIANVKSFTNEGYEIDRYQKSNAIVIREAIKYAISRGAFFSFIIFCLFGSLMLMVYIGVQMAVNDEMTAGQMMSFLMFTMFIAASMGGLPEQYAAIQRAVGASERIFELLDEPIEEVNADDARNRKKLRLTGDVTFDKIAFSYPTRKEFTVLRDVTFEAKAGQTIAIVGPSGSGKSTLAQLLLRFYEPDQGSLSFDGEKATTYDLTELRENMAIVPQDVLLFGGTIRENIAYGRPGATDEEVNAAALKANALTFIESFPDKFDTKVGDRGIQLSGGQRQRIAIARAVLKDPSILILDEATSSLDSESERVVQEALDKLMVGRTSFVIAHRLSTIRNADKIVVIDKGQVAETGTHDELMSNENGVYFMLNKLQFQYSASPQEN